MGASSAISSGCAVLDPPASLSKTGKEPIKPRYNFGDDAGFLLAYSMGGTAVVSRYAFLALPGFNIESADARAGAIVVRPRVLS